MWLLQLALLSGPVLWCGQGPAATLGTLGTSPGRQESSHHGAMLTVEKERLRKAQGLGWAELAASRKETRTHFLIKT